MPQGLLVTLVKQQPEENSLQKMDKSAKLAPSLTEGAHCLVPAHARFP